MQQDITPEEGESICTTPKSCSTSSSDGFATSFAEEMGGTVFVPSSDDDEEEEGLEEEGYHHHHENNCKSFWKKLLAYLGPGYLVAVG